MITKCVNQKNFTVMMITRRDKTMYYKFSEIKSKIISINGFEFK
ncbi:DUF1108 family protein, partial [Staphylococcus aureus]